MKTSLYLPCLTAFVVLATTAARADEMHLDLLTTGAIRKIGGYMPQKLELSTNKPDGLKEVPADLKAPLYGELKLGPAESLTSIFVILDEPDGKPSRLFVDTNANAKLIDDSAAEWKPNAMKSTNGVDYTTYNGGAEVKVSYGAQNPSLHVAFYRFDKHDPARAALTNFLFYYGDYARSGEVTLDGKSYPALLPDRTTCGDFRGKTGTNSPAVSLLIDVNHDGKFDSRFEAFPVNKPFNIAGTTYEISGITASGDSFQINKSTQTADETKPMADLSAGKPSMPFEKKTTDGETVKFPDTYKGKLVMLDFWATWCGPCVGELPHLTEAYEKFHPQGFEVLGVSLDLPDNGTKLAAFTKDHKMAWPQIYDGKFWSSEIAEKYYIHAIPQAYLVDGDTGTIVAEGETLRGDELAKTIEKALATKNAK